MKEGEGVASPSPWHGRRWRGWAWLVTECIGDGPALPSPSHPLWGETESELFWGLSTKVLPLPGLLGTAGTAGGSYEDLVLGHDLGKSEAEAAPKPFLLHVRTLRLGDSSRVTGGSDPRGSQVWGCLPGKAAVLSQLSGCSLCVTACPSPGHRAEPSHEGMLTGLPAPAATSRGEAATHTWILPTRGRPLPDFFLPV